MSDPVPDREAIVTPGRTKYRKKPVVIEAVQLTWDNWSRMCIFAGVGGDDDQPQGTFVDDAGKATGTVYPGDYGGGGARIGLLIPTLEGTMLGIENDWIIRGVQGELYPCKPDIFEATYEPADPS